MEKLNKERLLQLAAKLMRITEENGASPGEAANALAALQGIMDKHNLSMLDVEAAEAKKQFPVGEEFFISDYNDLPAHYMNLVSRIAEGFDVHIIMSKVDTPKGPRRKIIFIGQELDAILARYLYHRCGDELYRMASKEAKASGLRGTRITYFRESYINGAAETIGQRLTEERKKSKSANSQIGALMVLKENMNAEYINEKYPKLKSLSYSVRHGFGSEQGRAAGQRMDLSTRGVTGKSSATSERRLN